MVRAVPGLGKFEHDPVAVIGVAADHGHTVIFLRVQIQVLFIDLRDLLHGHDPAAVDDGHVELLLQIAVDRGLGDLLCQAGDTVL